NFRGAQRDDGSHRSAAHELAPEVSNERIHVHPLGRKPLAAVMPILSPSPAAGSEIAPARRSVTRPREAPVLDQCLEQERLRAVPGTLGSGNVPSTPATVADRPRTPPPKSEARRDPGPRPRSPRAPRLAPCAAPTSGTRAGGAAGAPAISPPRLARAFPGSP